jgi:hypothetical protein
MEFRAATPALKAWVLEKEKVPQCRRTNTIKQRAWLQRLSMFRIHNVIAGMAIAF